MKMLGVIALTMSLAACAGTRWFASEDQFKSYIAERHLSQMSVSGASAKLTSLGFACQSQEADVSCTKSVSHRFGGETQHVLISPPATPGSNLIVTAALDMVVI